MSQTAQTRVAETFEDASDDLENYFANTIIPQLFVDANYILRKFTPPAMKQFTLSGQDIGKDIHEIIENIRYPTFIQNLEEVFTTGLGLEKEIQTLDCRWFQMNILPYIIKKENKVNGAIITFVDITSRIKTLKELEKLNADNTTFIYSVSHDIRQPLSVLSLLSEAFRYDFTTKNEAGFIENIDRLKRATTTIDRIISDLSMLLKVRDDLSEAERINIQHICEDVIFALKDEIYSKNILIKTDFSITEFFFSRKNLRSIVYNLLSNAIKYRNFDRQLIISIKTSVEDGFNKLIICDNGLGIAQKDQEKIFEKYTRLSTTVDGTGIGLYLIRTMIENRGGKIKVESKLHEGSAFHVYFN